MPSTSTLNHRYAWRVGRRSLVACCSHNHELDHMQILKLQAIFPHLLPWQLFHAMRATKYNVEKAIQWIPAHQDELPLIERAEGSSHELDKLQSLYTDKVHKLAGALPGVPESEIRAMLTKCKGDEELAKAQLIDYAATTAAAEEERQKEHAEEDNDLEEAGDDAEEDDDDYEEDDDDEEEEDDDYYCTWRAARCSAVRPASQLTCCWLMRVYDSNAICSP